MRSAWIAALVFVVACGSGGARRPASVTDAGAPDANNAEVCATPEKRAAEDAKHPRVKPDLAAIAAELRAIEPELRAAVEAGIDGLEARVAPILARLDAVRAKAGAPAMAEVLRGRLVDAAANRVVCEAVAADDGAGCDALGGGRADGCKARVLLVRRLGVDMVAKRTCSAEGAKRAAALMQLVPAALVGAMCRAAVEHDAGACRGDRAQLATCTAIARGDLAACDAAGKPRRVEVCRQDAALLAAASGGVVKLGGEPTLGADDVLLVDVATGHADASTCRARVAVRVHDELQPAFTLGEATP